MGCQERTPERQVHHLEVIGTPGIRICGGKHRRAESAAAARTYRYRAGCGQRGLPTPQTRKNAPIALDGGICLRHAKDCLFAAVTALEGNVERNGQIGSRQRGWRTAARERTLTVTDTSTARPLSYWPYRIA